VKPTCRDSGELPERSEDQQRALGARARRASGGRSAPDDSLESGPEPDRHWFEGVADHLGEAYLRYSFTKGTAGEVAFLVEELGLRPGSRVLDVGCGPGRHAHALAARGIEVVGIDISQRFVDLARQGAPDGATFERVDARRLDFDAQFDAAYSLCQGAFGLLGGPAAGPDGPDDGAVLAGMARAVRPGGGIVVSAFSAYFQVRHLEGSAFDAATGTNHEVTEVLDAAGTPARVDLWTTCFTPRELRLLADAAGISPEAVYSGTPGRYARTAPNIDDEEFLLVGRRR
jgi:SAM-dependent methyltransferase